MAIDRRKFMQTGAVLAAGAATGCAGTSRTDALKSQADALLRGAVASGEVPGVVAALTTADETVYEAAAGVRVQGQPAAMGADTVMWIASMTKPVVGAAAMQLVEQGKLSLDAPAARVLPELGTFKVLDGWEADGKPRLRAPKTEITLRNLLTHTAGFTYDIWNPETARFHKVMNVPRAGSGRNVALRIPLSFDPGARWEYGINIDWAGKMVEAASGMRLGAYIRKNIADPLGMASTAFKITPEMRERLAKVHQRGADGKLAVTAFEVPQDPEFEPGGGGLYSTASDYQRFMRMILNRGRGNGNQVLRPETVDLMSRNAMGSLRVRMLPTQNPALSLDAEFFVGTPKTWGLSFMINEERAPTGRSPGSLAWAGLANTYFWIDPTKNIAGLAMMQVLPFVDPKSLALFTAYEKSVYASLA
jgi:CubicO group peptidase (beta-lactamase class C family)